MSITVQQEDNAYLEGSGEAEEIRGASADWPPRRLPGI